MKNFRAFPDGAALLFLIGAALFSCGNPESDNAVAVVAHDEAYSEARVSSTSSSKDRDTVVNEADFRIESTDDYASVREGVFFTTDSISGLEPSDKMDRFFLGQRVYVFGSLHSPRQETVQLDWRGPDGQIILPSTILNTGINTGPTGFRIFTYRAFRSPGTYTVTLRNGLGIEIGQLAFEVVQ